MSETIMANLYIDSDVILYGYSDWLRVSRDTLILTSLTVEMTSPIELQQARCMYFLLVPQNTGVKCKRSAMSLQSHSYHVNPLITMNQ